MRLIALALVLAASPALAQEMDHGAHQMDHSQHGMPAPNVEGPEIGDASAPPTPADHAADRFYPLDRMTKAREILAGESRIITFTALIDRLEYRAVDGKDGYGWEGEASYGGDIDRLVVASEGEGTFGQAPGQAEVRALWRHALDPWWNLQAGIRHDFRPDPERSYAVAGIEGLAPYWFEMEGQLFLSNKGDVHARAEASYDLRITQRLILQPAAEVNVAFQDVPEFGIAAGLESVELGARLRYEIASEFAPYVGVHWERKLGDTADLARGTGEKASAVSAVIGVRAWF
jgi:copper resistance protein B